MSDDRKPALLIDRVYRSCFDKRHPKPGLRAALESARRFVLDDPMAAFLGELTFECFTGRYLHIKPHRRLQHIHAGIDSLRHFARLPHKVTWVEFSMLAAMQRHGQLVCQFGSYVFIGSGKGHQPLPGERETAWREGWLLWQHDKIDTAFSALIFIGNSDYRAFVAHPIAITWDTEDGPLPWRQLPFAAAAAEAERTISETAVGCDGYVRDNVGFRAITEFNMPPFAENSEQAREEQNTLRGGLQQIWAFLATLNKIPVIGQHKVECARGFLARGGRYRRFLDHHVITLHVPEKADTRKLAQRALTELRRLRAHQVRGHFRDDWHKPKGNKSIWIAEHQRGDASLGFITHSYKVTHEQTDA